MSSGSRPRSSWWRTPRELAYDRELQRLYQRERIRQLPARCRAIRGAEDADLAEVLLRDLPYAPVMALALRDPDVRAAVALLPSSWTWST